MLSICNKKIAKKHFDKYHEHVKCFNLIMSNARPSYIELTGKFSARRGLQAYYEVLISHQPIFPPNCLPKFALDFIIYLISKLKDDLSAWPQKLSCKNQIKKAKVNLDVITSTI